MSNEELRGRFRRDFTQEPIRRQAPPPAQPAQVPTSPPPAAASPSSKSAHPHSEQFSDKPIKRRRNKSKYLILLIILLIVSSSGVYWYKFARVVSPVPAYITSSVDYPLLYPSKLPAGYQLVKTSFTSSNGIVIYQANGSGSGHIVFTVQKRPPTFDFDTFYKQGLSKATTFNTPLGQAAIGIANGAQVGSLATDQSWILVNPVSTGIQSDGLRLILDNIRQTASKS